MKNFKRNFFYPIYINRQSVRNFNPDDKKFNNYKFIYFLILSLKLTIKYEIIKISFNFLQFHKKAHQIQLETWQDGN